MSHLFTHKRQSACLHDMFWPLFFSKIGHPAQQFMVWIPLFFSKVYKNEFITSFLKIYFPQIIFGFDGLPKE